MLEAALSGQALYYHRVGTPQSEDRLIYERKDLPAWFVSGIVDRGWPLSARLHVRGLRQQQPPLLRRPRRSAEAEHRRAGQAARRDDDAEYLAVWQQRVDASICGPTRTRPTAR